VKCQNGKDGLIAIGIATIIIISLPILMIIPVTSDSSRFLTVLGELLGMGLEIPRHSSDMGHHRKGH